jgi:glycosyltransferase domain-containing protein
VLDDSLRDACIAPVEYRRFEPTVTPYAKITTVARSVVTSYVAMMTDDDVSFPQTIDACLDHLELNPDVVVAQGYVLRFSAAPEVMDIHNMQWFVGSITKATPLERLYELMRRYQPFFWAVFRTDAYLRAADAAMSAKGAFFEELAFTATLALLGNSARLPMIHTLRRDEDSQVPPAEGHPFFWFLRDSPSFFAGYVDYRNQLVDLLREFATIKSSQTTKADEDRETHTRAHALDVIHASYFGREIDMGMVNHTARFLVGDLDSPVVPPKPTRHDAVVGAADLVHTSASTGRQYVWRNAVMDAGSRPEATISLEEIARVEAALDLYSPPATSEVLREPLIARKAAQWALAENVSLQRDENGFRVAANSGYGHHRVRGRIEGGQAGQTVALSLQAKSAGCSRVKLEVLDEGGTRYAASTFDLADGIVINSDSPVTTSISAAEDGYFDLSLGLVLASSSEIHFTIALLKADNAVVYTGGADGALLLRKIDVR